MTAAAPNAPDAPDGYADDAPTDDERIACRPGRLRDVEWRHLAVRFVFGAAVSLGAGIVAEVWGERFGGLFLAFPAILPATVTMLEANHGNRHARHDNYGAACAVPGLASFALTVYLLRDHPALALPLATVAWLLTALVLYALYQRLRRVVNPPSPW